MEKEFFFFLTFLSRVLIWMSKQELFCWLTKSYVDVDHFERWITLTLIVGVSFWKESLICWWWLYIFGWLQLRILAKPNSDCKNSQVPRSSNVFGPMSLLAVTLLQREQNKECEGFWHSAVRLVSPLLWLRHECLEGRQSRKDMLLCHSTQPVCRVCDVGMYWGQRVKFSVY